MNWHWIFEIFNFFWIHEAIFNFWVINIDRNFLKKYRKWWVGVRKVANEIQSFSMISFNTIFSLSWSQNIFRIKSPVQFEFRRIPFIRWFHWIYSLARWPWEKFKSDIKIFLFILYVIFVTNLFSSFSDSINNCFLEYSLRFTGVSFWNNAISSFYCDAQQDVNVAVWAPLVIDAVRKTAVFCQMYSFAWRPYWFSLYRVHAISSRSYTLFCCGTKSKVIWRIISSLNYRCSSYS